jgi:hypothetical protein
MITGHVVEWWRIYNRPLRICWPLPPPESKASS